MLAEHFAERLAEKPCAERSHGGYAWYPIAVWFIMSMGDLQDPTVMEVPTIYKAYIRPM